MDATRYLPVPLTAEDAQRLDALAVLTGKHKRLILSEIIHAQLDRLDSVIVPGTSCTPSELRRATMDALRGHGGGGE